ncbi:hypothetical protein CBL_12245 [Carabus blaptoides fortunei]
MTVKKLNVTFPVCYGTVTLRKHYTRVYKHKVVTRAFHTRGLHGYNTRASGAVSQVNEHRPRRFPVHSATGWAKARKLNIDRPHRKLHHCPLTCGQLHVPLTVTATTKHQQYHQHS